MADVRPGDTSYDVMMRKKKQRSEDKAMGKKPDMTPTHAEKRLANQKKRAEAEEARKKRRAARYKKNQENRKAKKNQGSNVEAMMNMSDAEFTKRYGPANSMR